MTDQGWMVDDGTCDLCVRGQCWQCIKPMETYGDRETLLLCCCNESYVLQRIEQTIRDWIRDLHGIMTERYAIPPLADDPTARMLGVQGGEPQGGDDHDRRD